MAEKKKRPSARYIHPTPEPLRVPVGDVPSAFQVEESGVREVKSKRKKRPSARAKRT